MDMIERVARNIELYSRDWPHEWDALPLHVRETRRVQARAAMEAMREPTNAMLEGAGAMDNYDMEAPGGRPDDDHRRWWSAMIDAALGPQVNDGGKDE